MRPKNTSFVQKY